MRTCVVVFAPLQKPQSDSGAIRGACVRLETADGCGPLRRLARICAQRDKQSEFHFGGVLESVTYLERLPHRFQIAEVSPPIIPKLVVSKMGQDTVGARIGGIKRLAESGKPGLRGAGRIGQDGKMFRN